MFSIKRLATSITAVLLSLSLTAVSGPAASALDISANDNESSVCTTTHSPTTSPTSAADDTYVRTTAANTADSQSTTDADGIESRSVHTQALKLALKAIAKVLRNSPEYIIKLADPFLDAAAKKALRNNIGAIADAIDSVANIPNIATSFVRQEVYKALKGIVGAGNAEVIASAIEGILQFFL